MEVFLILKRGARYRCTRDETEVLGQMAIIIIFVALSIHESETIDMDTIAVDALAELLVGMAMDCF